MSEKCIKNGYQQDYDVEHVFAKSWATHIGKPEISDDYVNLKYSVKTINNARSNLGFGVLDHTASNVVSVRDEFNNICGWKNSTIFEPLDEYKGDIARTLLYIIYNYDLKISDYSDYFSKTLMIEWAKLDKISEEEKSTSKNIRRNQKYENFFIRRGKIINYIK